MEYYFYHGAAFNKYPLPERNPLTLAADMRVAVCNVCPLATHGHICVPSDENPHSYTKYCTLTAIATGLINIDDALADGQAEPTIDDRERVEALINSLGNRIQAKIVPEPEQPPQIEKPRPRKTAYLCGWMSAELPDRPSAQLYVYKQRNDWGVTYEPAEASRFKAVEAVLEWYRVNGTVHGDPEVNSYNGHLKIFEDSPSGLRLVPRPTRQTSLFDNLPSLEIIETQPDLLKVPDSDDCFTSDESKLLAAGYVLVKYNRELKTIQQTYIPPKKGWAPSVTFGTYAAAERTLKEALAAENVVEVSLEGKVNMSTCRNKLRDAGFDFYRSEGIIPGHGHDVPRIKQASLNWGTWAKYETPEELQAAWDELMKDGKALQG